MLAVRADFYGRCARLSGAGRAARREPRAGRPDVARRAAPGDRAARAARRAERRAGARRRAARRRRGPGRARCRCCPPRCSSSGGVRDGRRLRLAAYSRSGGVQGAVARLAEDAFVAPRSPTQQAIARNVLLRLAGEGEGGAIVRRRRVAAEPSSPASRAEVVARLDRPPAADRQATARSRSRTRRCCASGRGCAAGWRRTRRAGGCTASSATPRAPGTPTRATRARLYRGARLRAALEWRAAHEAELNASERAFLDAGRAAAERAQRRLRLVLGGVSLLLVAGGDRRRSSHSTAARQRARARARPPRRSDSAPRRSPSRRSTARCCWRARPSRSTTTRRRADKLLAALLRSPAAIRVMRGDGGRMLAVAARPDGEVVVAGDNAGRLMLFDAGGGASSPGTTAAARCRRCGSARTGRAWPS